MLLSRSLRRLVAVIAAALFLACQGMAVARASPPLAFPQSNAATAPESCRDTGQDTSKNTDDNVCQAWCQSQNASSTLFKVSVFTAADLPALITGSVQPVHVAQRLTPVEPALARAQSPPLPIVLCRLRN